MTEEWGFSDSGRLLFLAAERTTVGAGVQRLAAVPAEGFFRRLSGLQPPPDVFHLGGGMVDLPRGGEVVDDLGRALVAPFDLVAQRLHDDVGHLARNLAVAQLGRRQPT